MEARFADDLVPFRDVRVLESTGPALLCRIGGRQVWLPRHHIRGNLWCVGDRGTLCIRRWIALDRHLLPSEPLAVILPVVLPGTVPMGLHLVDGGKRHGH